MGKKYTSEIVEDYILRQIVPKQRTLPFVGHELNFGFCRNIDDEHTEFTNILL